MKNLLYIAMAVFCLASCSSDDDNGPDINLDNLQKRWYNVSTKFGNGTPTPYDGHLSCGKDYLEFGANNTVRDVDVVDCQSDPTVITGAYSASETTLTTTLEGETLTYNINRLTTSALEIQTTFNGAAVVYIYTSTP